MAAFSSRGPTDDGRIKPDVVAPGTWILSAYSDLYQQGYDAIAQPEERRLPVRRLGLPVERRTTSTWAARRCRTRSPRAARQSCAITTRRPTALSASAALVKATLINSAVDLLDENNDGANDNDFPIPNNHEGWGRVNLAAATDGTAQYVDDSRRAGTNGTQTFQYTVNGGPLKVTLVWSDYPSTDAATVNLVNDLDLVVTAPGGTLPRQRFSGGWSADRRHGGSPQQRRKRLCPDAGGRHLDRDGQGLQRAQRPAALRPGGGR